MSHIEGGFFASYNVTSFTAPCSLHKVAATCAAGHVICTRRAFTSAVLLSDSAWSRISATLERRAYAEAVNRRRTVLRWLLSVYAHYTEKSFCGIRLMLGWLCTVFISEPAGFWVRSPKGAQVYRIVNEKKKRKKRGIHSLGNDRRL